LAQANVMDVGAKAGYYTEKSPKMMLLEWCQQQKRPTPRYRTTAAEGDSAGKCKVYATQICSCDLKRHCASEGDETCAVPKLYHVMREVIELHL